MTSVPWRDKAGITHAWQSTSSYVEWSKDNHHAGWYTARAPCGASRRLRHGRDSNDRRRNAIIDCMTCLIREGEKNR